ncbi:hypothetical protein B9Z55_013008 [Caenorhabditis nigoni]|uniref:T-box domain-containing protein n=1 Tax=Caenorhabditis nigoni TaxID=1611254 RepID=A0A2G5TZT1_9PELO|nr:hypothetical protein B9Z55_013008 [Caenorhabditis nigoni]
MNTITVRCTSEEAWEEKGKGGITENTANCAEIILNKFPPENLGFEYEVTGLEEDSSYEMELLFDASKYSNNRFTRGAEKSFRRCGAIPIGTKERKITHEKMEQTGCDWMKSTVNFDKVWFRNEHKGCNKPADAKYKVDLISTRMYQVKLRIRKQRGAETIVEIPHQYFVACSDEYKSSRGVKKEYKKKNKTSEDSDAVTDTFEPTEEASQKRRSQGMTPSTSDNFGMFLIDPPKRQAFDPSTGNPIQPIAFGAFWPTVNPTQLQPLNIGLTSAQSLLSGIPLPLLQQEAGPLINTQQVNIEERLPNMMPSTSDNSFSHLFEQQMANGILPHVYPEYPPPVNIEQGQPQIASGSVEEPPINPQPGQEPPRHPEQD